MDQTLANALGTLWGHLSRRRHWQFRFVILLTIVSASSEVVSLGAVIPFIAVITQPEIVMEYTLVALLAENLGITSGEELVVPLSVAFGLAALTAGGLRLFLVWSTIQLGNGCGADLSVAVYRRTLYQPYSVSLTRSSSEIISGTTQKIAAVSAILTSGMVLVTALFLFFAIVSTLILVDPWTALACAGSFALAYSGIAWTTKNRLSVNSKIIAKEQGQVVKALQEGVGSIRDVLLDGSQELFIGAYSESVHRLKQGHCQNAFINQFPRYAMEAFGLILIACFVVYLSSGDAGVVGSLTVLGVLALGAQRLLPITQQIFGNWSVLLGNRAALADILALLDRPASDDISCSSAGSLAFRKAISFDNVSYRYSESGPLVLKNISLVIPKGARVGVVGGTGGGKSTLLDLLMGLLAPSEGVISIDGNPLDKQDDIASWQRSIAHVPQNIYLADRSIAENIAFGIAPEKIDLSRVKEAAEAAEIAEFIGKGSEGYDAMVGERGVRLSGGQLQRIGIARALYKKADVIVFDEATSALDDKTERAVMKTIEGLSGEITMFLVAHRVSTLRSCDFIVRLDGGKVVGQYDFDTVNSQQKGVQ